MKIIRGIPLALIIVILVITSQSCKKEKTYDQPADYINPFIGTGGHGHTYPGATTPFGMVQLSPDTRKDSWDGCSGYHYSDDFILGFSHLHLSGTGVGDYGDIRFVPMTGELKTTPGSKEDANGYGSSFSHDNEKAKAGYYKVKLDNGIDVELTATQRAGMHRYTFPDTEKATIIIDLIESVVTEKIIEAEISFISDHEVVGFRRTKAWANDQKTYFYASFSQPFTTHGIVADGEYWQNKNTSTADSLIAVMNFDLKGDKQILAMVGISSVDINSAIANCKKEIPSWDFNKVKDAAFDLWNEKMKKIEVSGGTFDERSVFYTAMYHSLVAPNMYSDVDGRYRAHDNQIYTDKTFEMHTVFSLWDTFRSLHPLFTIIEQDKTNDLINSMLDMYKHDGLLPVWELAGCETNCMIGYNSIPVITDAWIKNIRDYDAELALNAMVKTAKADQFGLRYFMSKGYIPADKEGESVSKTLEYAYDDWCIATLAKGLGNAEIYNNFIQRAQYYKNIYDDETGFFRGKSNGCFVTPFDPTQVNFMLTEANTWQYNFFVPQDINTHIELLGSDVAYESKLDTLFNTTAELSGRHQSDITGLIGQYAHGNEPSHHMAYLYNYVGAPWKTQQTIHNICSNLYFNEPDGLSGNEDCGQMSAWYVLSAMGFYPVTPGTNYYVIGTPVFETAEIRLENGNIFKIIANRSNPESFYVNSLLLNGKEYLKSYIDHETIMAGGELVFELTDQPNKEFGNNIAHRPNRKITDELITPVPYFKAPSKTFSDNMVVEIHDISKGSKIEYSTDNNFKDYTSPLTIKNTTDFEAVSQIAGNKSLTESATFINIPEGRSVKVNTKFSNQYTAGGDIALINTIRGGDNFRTGNWQGYYGEDLEAIIDLGELTDISVIGAGFLQDENSWIFMPTKVEYYGSRNGVDYKKLGTVINDIDPKQTGGIIKGFKINAPETLRFIKIHAANMGTCPEWHKGYPNPSWIFVDEVWVE